MDKFLSDVQKKPKKSVTDTGEPEDSDKPAKTAFPKGVVLGKDGKP